MYNIGIDLGGTNIKVGVVDENYNIVGRSNIKTNLPRPSEEIVESIDSIIDERDYDMKDILQEQYTIVSKLEKLIQ